ncbi:uncharacterized protein LAESUDRAFT_146479 [Laetiporus sulphureus 93-53]|uniref:Uncharacterized protein n=1 Tax=Laetiporus sulphureus 93-53 TaxID=1314785 RepID=A0A165EB40_9APHY|nr:uncharacterized protein LAESUDRAFT_146479 [Laetiporus sulphureus 93-53]KZT06639.1 hypothetical protein LAESUDRAFT_146479 [Laetiporus sulphureus 93-53]
MLGLPAELLGSGSPGSKLGLKPSKEIRLICRIVFPHLQSRVRSANEPRWRRDSPPPPRRTSIPQALQSPNIQGRTLSTVVAISTVHGLVAPTAPARCRCAATSPRSTGVMHHVATGRGARQAIFLQRRGTLKIITSRLSGFVPLATVPSRASGRGTGISSNLARRGSVSMSRRSRRIWLVMTTSAIDTKRVKILGEREGGRQDAD